MTAFDASTAASLRAAFAGRFYTDDADMAPYLTDWRRKWTGRALAVAEPNTTPDVAAVVRWCYEHKVPVVPQGGNTGMAGGATPDESGRALVLSLRRLNKIRCLDPINNTITAEAGVVLQQVQIAAHEASRLFPLSLGAQGSCTIGGNLATNAGGVQVLRYGNARELCLGLEVVTVDGEVWDGLRALRKDNTGYDLRDLFIGSEGTLGVITAAVLKLFPLPAARVVCLAAVPSPDDAVNLLELAQRELGSSLTAFELISDICIALVEKHIPGTRMPFAERSPWYALLEVSNSQNESRAVGELESLLSVAIDQGLVSDAALSKSLAQFEALWALRENIGEAQRAEGSGIKHDISLPISRIAEFIETTDVAIAKRFPGPRMVVFGHVGDGNLHYNISAPTGQSDCKRDLDFEALEGPINRLVHDSVVGFGGSVSAEHGIGVLRRDEAVRYKSSVELKLMRAIKTALDPLDLMNPGKGI